METIRTALAGALGRMGSVIGPGLEATPGITLVARIEKGEDLAAMVRASRAEVVVDFTTPESAAANARAILEAGAHGVIGTTGLTEDDLHSLDARARAAKRGLLVAPNFAIGAVLMQRFAAEAARFFPRAEIVEMHHDGKRDAPSGTALRTAEAIADAGSGGGPGGLNGSGLAARGAVHRAVHVHSIRLPGLVAHQEVLFGGTGECLTIRHDSLSRECFLPGVVLGVREVRSRVGLLRGLESLLLPSPRAPR